MTKQSDHQIGLWRCPARIGRIGWPAVATQVIENPRNHWFFRLISPSIPLTTTRQVRGPAVTYYFDNLLPENPDVRKRISTRFSVRADTFNLLTAIGRDCVGAVHGHRHGRRARANQTNARNRCAVNAVVLDVATHGDAA